MVDRYVKDLESRADGAIQSYNIVGLAPAVGQYKHVAATRIGTEIDEMGYLLEISGMLALDENSNVVGTDCKTQTEKIIDNLAQAISGAGRHHGRIIDKKEALEYVTSTMVLLKDMKDFSAINEVYKNSGIPNTCRAAFAAQDLPLSAKGVVVEIRANAYLPVQ